MKYRELQKALASMTEDQLDMDVSIILLRTEEMYPVVEFMQHWVASDALEDPGDNDPVAIAADILDDNSPFFVIDC